MARRKTRTVYRKAKSVVRRARTFGGGGKFKHIIDGALAGAGGQLATKYVGAYGHPAASLGIGFFRNNSVLLTEGAREMGAMLAAKFVGGGETPGGFVTQG